MIDHLKDVGIQHLADTVYSYCSRAQSERLEYLQQRSLFLQADQAKALKRISDGLDGLQSRLRSGREAGTSQGRQGHFTRGDVDFLKEKLQSLCLSEIDVKKQQSIMESLTFESRPVRHTQIAEHHEKTFEWALTTNQDSTVGASIGDWLREGDGIFWVSGRPGSGKSTLMKYIADSSITSRFITEWARPCRAAIVSHYFWIAGTSEQKSQKGLLQTLLYDIFRQYPDLIKQTCAKRWNSSQSAGSCRWSEVELHKALQTVVTSDHADLKLCFMIDGLDEYSGDHEGRTQLCRTLKGLASSGNVKLCLSSRPWNVFEEQFGLNCPKIYMQDLTRDDIQNYVSSRLEEHTRWAAVSAKHSQGQWLVSEIAAKSNGVFLWVFLVTKLLREGLTNRDAFVDLRRRLESFPSELESFFKTMLQAVEPFYHSHMSTALQIANTSTDRQFSFLVYSFHFQEYEDSNYAIDHPIRLMDEDEIGEIRSNTSWHLDSRTRGLLEVNTKDGSVSFLHRTVRDFLNTQEMYDFLADKVDSRLNFRPNLSILKALTAMIKTCSTPKEIMRQSFGKFKVGSVSDDGIPLLRLVSQALHYASEIESNTAGEIRHHALLDELDRSLPCLLSGSNCRFGTSFGLNIKDVFFREQLVHFSLFDYILSKLDFDPEFLQNIGALPVLQLLSPDPIRSIQLQPGRGTDFLLSLLDKRGINPNKKGGPDAISPWNELLKHTCQRWTSQRKIIMRTLSFLLEGKILKLFLKAGADPSTLIVGPCLTSGTRRSRAAAIFYLQFCFDVLDQSPRIQALYLDVLSEFLRLSHQEVLRNVIDEFCAILNQRDKEELHWSFPFLAKVHDTLRLSLSARGPEAAGSLHSLHQTAKQVFPSNLYTPLNAATEPRKRKRKQKSGSGRKQKNQRQE